MIALNTILFILSILLFFRFITGGFLWYQNKIKPEIFTKEIYPLSYNIGLYVAVIIWGLLIFVL